MAVRAYVRLDPDFPDHKGSYPDGAFAALVMCFCFGAQQPRPGTFRNRKLLAVLLDKRTRWLPYLIEHEDLIEQSDGSLYIEGWSEWQEGNWQVAERMQRVRARKAANRNAGDGANRNHGDGGSRNTLSDTRPARRDAGDAPHAPRESASASAFDKSVSVAPARDHDHGSRSRGTTNGLEPIGAAQLPPPLDEELIARDRAILEDPTTPEWKREAALTHLAGLGVHS
jgi:hypothetical protein